MVQSCKQEHTSSEWSRWPRNKPTLLQHTIFDKDAKNLHSRKDIFMEKWHWGSWISKCRQMKLNPLSSCIGINSKWTRCLSVKTVRGKTTKSDSRYRHRPGLWKDSSHPENKVMCWKMGLHEVKIKSSAQPKKQSCGKTAVQWGEIFSSYTFDRWLISRIFKILNPNDI